MVSFGSRNGPFYQLSYKEINDESLILHWIHVADQIYKEPPSKAVSSVYWKSLPKKLWFYEQDRVETEVDALNRARVEKYCVEANIDIFRINRQTIHQHFTLPERQTALRDKISSKLIVYLDILQLLNKEGGIFLSNKLGVADSFDWLINLSSDELFFNRYDETPSLVHFFHSDLAKPSYDLRYGVRTADSSLL